MAKQISIFESEELPPGQPGCGNNFLFSDRALEKVLRKSREWRAAKAPAGLHDALSESKKTGCPRPVLEALGWHALKLNGNFILLSGKKYAPKGAPHTLVLVCDPEDAQSVCRLLFEMEKEKAPWGAASNGAKWRLLRADLPAAPARWFEADFTALAAGADDDLKTFALLFGPAAYSKKETFADAAHRASRERAAEIREKLKIHCADAATAICRGFVFSEKQATGATPTDNALEMIYKHSLVIVHRIVYILYAESRGILPGEGAAYRAELGIGGLAGRIAELRAAKKKPSSVRIEYWETLRKLFGLIHHGDEELGIPFLGGPLFDPEAHPFLSNNHAPDSFMAVAIEALAPAGGKLGRHGDAFSELDPTDILAALAPLAEFRPRFAAEPMLLIEDKGRTAWLPKKTVKWKKALASVAAGEIHLERSGRTAPRAPQWETVRSFASKAFESEYSGTGPVLVPETCAGITLLAGIDASARRRCASAASGNAPFAEALSVAARRTYGLDANPLNADLARLGVWLLTIGDEPPVCLEHNVRAGGAMCGATPGELANLPAGSQINTQELNYLAHEVRQAWARQRPGLAGVRAREAGLRKVDRKIERLYALPDLWAASGWMTARQFGEKDAGIEKTRSAPPMPGRAGRIIHLPVQFPEIFYSEERFNGFEAVLAVPSAARRLTSEESRFLQKKLGLRGAMSVPDAAARRFAESLAPGGVLALLAPARFLDSTRAKALLKHAESSPAFSSVATEKLPGGFAMIVMRKK